MRKSYMYIAIVDDPNHHDVDFYYTACKTKDIAVNFLMDYISQIIDNNEINPNDHYTLEEIRDLLTKEECIEFCDVYYRITKCDYIGEKRDK